MPTQTLTLDVPAKLWMTANGRLHHYARHDRTKQLRTMAGWQARKHLEPTRGVVHVMAFVSSPKRSRADVGNAYSTVKPLIDGITDARIWTDDSDEHLIGPDMRRDGPTGTPGLYRVRIVITPQTPEF